MGDNFKVKVLMLKGEKGDKGDTGSIDNLKIGGVNLIDSSKLIIGWYDRIGNLVVDENYQTTNHIPLKNANYLTVQEWCTDAVNIWLCFSFYDADKTFIRQNIKRDYSNYLLFKSQIPESAKYVALSYNKGKGIKCKLEFHETPTDWTPSLEDIENEINNIKARLEALESK